MVELFQAIEDNDINAVIVAIDSGISVESLNEDGLTALLFAAYNNRTEIAKYLIEYAGASLTATTKPGNTLLMCAALKADPEFIEYLLSHYDMNVNAKGDEGRSALIYAVSRCHFLKEYIYEHIIKKTVNFNSDGMAYVRARESVPTFEDKQKAMRVVTLLVEQGNAEIELSDNDGETPLMYSAESGFFEEFEYLISKGADVTRKDVDGGTLLKFVAYGGNIDILTYLIEKYDVDIEKEVDENGCTMLCLAADASHLNMVKYLIEDLYVDINGHWRGELTVASAAASGDDLSVLEYLVEKGVNLYEENKHNENALFKAAENKDIRFIKYLVQHGMDAHMRDGAILLRAIESHNSIEVIKYLIEECGMQILDKHINGVITHGRQDVMEYFIERGIDMTILSLPRWEMIIIQMLSMDGTTENNVEEGDEESANIIFINLLLVGGEAREWEDSDRDSDANSLNHEPEGQE